MSADNWRQRRIAIAGTGLIGGSILLRLSEIGLDAIGWDPGVTDRRGLPYADSLAEAVADRDLVFLAGPLNKLPELLQEVAESTSDDCLITDVGSTKCAIDLAGAPHAARFLPGHPMAGSEKAGLDAADPALFKGCTWVLCPYSGQDLTGFRTLTDFLINAFGAKVVPMRPVTHDTVAAMASHIPHLLASTLAGTAARSPQRQAIMSLAAGSFRDGTRVAGTPSKRVTDMIAGNRSAVLRQLTQVRDFFTILTSALERGDDEALLAALTEANGLRHDLLHRRPEPVRLDLPLGDPSERETLLRLGESGGHLASVTIAADRVSYSGWTH